MRRDPYNKGVNPIRTSTEFLKCDSLLRRRSVKVLIE